MNAVYTMPPDVADRGLQMLMGAHQQTQHPALVVRPRIKANPLSSDDVAAAARRIVELTAVFWQVSAQGGVSAEANRQA